MRIAVGPTDLGGCGFYRLIAPFQALSAVGKNVRFVRQFSLQEALEHTDIFVTQRADTPGMVSLLRELGRIGRPKVLIDYDDHFHDVPAYNPHSAQVGKNKPPTRAAVEAMKLSYLVTCSTEDLAHEYRGLNERFAVIQNAMADELFFRYVQEPCVSPGREIRIGWAGTQTHRGDLEVVVKALIRIGLVYQHVRFVFFGDDFRSMFPAALQKRIDLVPPMYATSDISKGVDEAANYMAQFYARLNGMKLDIAIAPLVANTFNKCKSHVKLLEYGQAGFPVVASRVGPYKRYAAEAPETVRACGDTHEWERALSELIENESARLELARANQQHIRERHLVSHRVPLWEGVLAGVPVARTVQAPRANLTPTLRE